MAAIYKAKQGQTWDDIALEVYGSEVYADFLMQSNLPLLDILIFSAGTVLSTPDLIVEITGDQLPWTGEDEDGTIDPYA